MNIVHTYIDNMYIDQNDESKHSFAQKWGLVSLAKRGHQVTLLCGSRTDTRQEFIWNNIKVIQLPSKIKLTNSTKILKNFTTELKNLKPDIIHTHHYASFIPELSLLHAKMNRIPIVLTIHTSFTEGSVPMKILASIYLTAMQLFLPFYDHTTFISKYLQNKWRFKLVKNKSSVVYNQIPAPRYLGTKEIITQSAKNILYIGRLSHQKGVDLLIKSMKEVKKQIPSAKLQIVGNGSEKYTNKLKKICKINHLQDCIEFLGYKRGTEKAKIYQNSSTMIIPSRDEGFGNVIIEGLLNKIPLVIANNGALPEAASGFATIFKKNNPAELAKSIIKSLNLHGSKEQLETLEQGHNSAIKFTTEKIAIDLEQVYTSLL